ncbi:class I SAM-dependent methyltransferase [Patescibacteria group bacterium]|nr:class I SAM-dependent methyltransferase [Patescibacteria group bacterium]
MKHQKQKLDEIHHSIPGDYYDTSIIDNPIKKVFHQNRFKHIGQMLAGTNGKLLDIGCAGGTFTNELSKCTNADITALDISPQAIDYARQTYPHIDFQVHDAASSNFPYDDNSFDIVTILETLEHVLNPVEILQEMRRLVKPDGQIIVLVPYEDWIFNIGWSVWTSLPGDMGGGVWDESHVQRFDGRKLRHLMEFIGYEILDEQRFNLGLLLAILARPKEPNVNY